MCARRLSLILLLGMFLCTPLKAQKKMSTAEARNHIGETATVCGNVVSTRYASSTKGQPTFFNLDKPYPNQVFTVVIWGKNGNKFATPDHAYKAKRISFSGNPTA